MIDAGQHFVCFDLRFRMKCMTNFEARFSFFLKSKFCHFEFVCCMSEESKIPLKTKVLGPHKDGCLALVAFVVRVPRVPDLKIFFYQFAQWR